MRRWAGTVSGIQREKWPEISKLIESEQKRIGARADGIRRDQLPKTIPKLTALIREMVGDYADAVELDEDSSDARVEVIEKSLESTSSTAWADNIESKVAKTPRTTTTEKIEISEFLISEEPGIPRKIRRNWIREQLGLISAKPVSPVRVAGKLIETISGRSMKRLNTIVTKGILRGTRVESIMGELAGLPGMTKRHAELIARDQIVKQNGRMTRIRHEGIGVTHYLWESVGDQRVRKTHRAFARKGRNRYSYKKGAGPNGVNPGEEIQCRCWASPDLIGAVKNLRGRKAVSQVSRAVVEAREQVTSIATLRKQVEATKRAIAGGKASDFDAAVAKVKALDRRIASLKRQIAKTKKAISVEKQTQAIEGISAQIAATKRELASSRARGDSRSRDMNIMGMPRSHRSIQQYWRATAGQGSRMLSQPVVV